jgi:hypothetical protein
MLYCWRSRSLPQGKIKQVQYNSLRTHSKRRLLSIGGNVRDQSQGIYADIVTYQDSGNFKIYIGAATTVPGGHKVIGLRRRIREHLAHAKLQRHRLSTSAPHANKTLNPNADINFVILVQFPNPVPVPLVHITEAVMTILFTSLENRTFSWLRPVHLVQSGKWGLNEASPLEYSIISKSDKARAHQSEYRQKRAAKERDRMITTAPQGCNVRVTRANLNGKPRGFQFNFCSEHVAVLQP